MASEWKIHQLCTQFTESGIGSPAEGMAAYALARLVPELMKERAEMLRRLKESGELPKQRRAA